MEITVRTLVTALLVLAAAGIVRADDDQRFLAGLRERRLFSLADAYCRERLADPKLTPVAQANLTIEWIRVRAEQAANASAAERESLWVAAAETAASFLREHADHPRAELVRVQDALTALARGELARQEAEVAPNPEPALQRAREALRAAAAQFDQLDRDLNDEIPRRNRRRLQPDELSSAELVSLRNNVQLQRARTLRNQALSYPPGSADRIASLASALQQLEQPLTRIGADDPLIWQIRLEQIQAQRLLGSVSEAASLLNKLLADSPPIDVQQRAAAEKARVHLAASQPDQALEAIAQATRQEGDGMADLDLALFEAHLAKWQATQRDADRTESDAWQKKTLALVQYIEQTHGPYWGRRAEAMLIHVAGRRESPANVEIIRRTAENLYLKGNLDEAVAAYDQGAELARQAGDEDLAFELGYKAALVQQQRKLRADSAQRLTRLSTAMPAQEEAAKAHLLAVWITAQRVRDREAELSDYTTRLDEQLRLWPADPATDQARLWLGQLREQQQAWAAATAAYRGVPARSEHFESALPAAARSARRQLAASAAAGELDARQAAELVDHFVRIARETSAVADEHGDNPPVELGLRRFAALTAAELAIEYLPDGAARAESVLAAFGDSGQSDEQAAAARALMLLALAGQPNRADEAERLLGELRGSSPAQLFQVVDGLARLQSSSPRQRMELANMQLRAIGWLEPNRSSLTAEQRQQLDVSHAEALSASGNLEMALVRYEQLCQADPDNGVLRERFAELLLESSGRARLQQALVQWRTIAARSRPETDRWWRAKYAVARAHFQLGEKEDAAKLIRYLQATKGLGDAASTARFEQLLRQCQ